eukprot:g694.t1
MLFDQGETIDNVTAVKSSFQLDSKRCVYVLTIETPTQIDMIFVQSDLDIELMQGGERNVAILCKSRSSEENGTLATYRCPTGESMNRIEIEMKSVEGQFGILKAIVVPKMGKAELIKVKVKPLDLFYRIRKAEECEEEGKNGSSQLNNIVFTGNFKARVMHEWIGFCLPDVPTRIDEDIVDGIELYFKNANVDTLLECIYKDGQAKFSSDSVATLGIIKEVIMKKGSERKIQLRVKANIETRNIANMINTKLAKKVKEIIQLTEKIKVLEGIKEIVGKEMEQKKVTGNRKIEMMIDPEWRKIVQNEEDLRKRFEGKEKEEKRILNLVVKEIKETKKFLGREEKGGLEREWKREIKRGLLEEVVERELRGL